MHINFKDYLLESSKEDHVGIFIGRIQGLTMGHAKVIDIMEKTHKKNYIVIVKGIKSSQDKVHNPFPLEVQQKMLNKIIGPNTDLVTAPRANLEDLLPKLGSKNFVIYSGPDRLSGYRSYASDAIKQGFHVKVIDTGQMLPRDESISGTKLRQSLKNNDIETFKKITPQKIWNMFDELRSYIR